jgi:hypothetical protein
MEPQSFETLRAVLGWSTLINFVILTWWFAWFALARDSVRRLHGRWFAMPDAQFDAIHYGGMVMYKLGILLFNLVPYLALRIAT